MTQLILETKRRSIGIVFVERKLPSRMELGKIV
ncbi:hypothetical protein ACVMB0_000005 [Bradyrhizobium sp. USDA 4451]